MVNNRGPLIGRELGKWRIDRLLGEGGVGTVYAARHRNGMKAAVKVLQPDLASNSSARTRFLQEGYAANAVEHPGVVRVLDDDVTPDGMAYLVMELLEGESLEDMRLRMGGLLPLHLVKRFGLGLLDVLAAAHERDIIHRDIKPDNLFVLKDGTLKVLDFGLAKLKHSVRKVESTKTGILLGTPGFMPPERAAPENDVPDPRTDIWAVGATLFLLASGAYTHDGETPLAILVATTRERARSLRTVAPDVPDGLVDVVDRALAYEKEGRWPTAIAMREALAAVVVEEEEERPRAPGPASTPDVATIVDRVIPKISDDDADIGLEETVAQERAGPSEPRIVPVSQPRPAAPAAVAAPAPTPNRAPKHAGMIVAFALVAVALVIASVVLKFLVR